MTDTNIDKYSQTIIRLLEDLFDIGVIYRQKEFLTISLTSHYDRKQSITILKDRLTLAGYRFTLDEKENDLLLNINPKPEFKIPRINIVLFILTIFSVYFIPVFYDKFFGIYLEATAPVIENNPSTWQLIKLGLSVIPGAINQTLNALAQGEGIIFTLALMTILFFHEMGHFIASRRRNIITTWPYFIPAPNIIGTFGAIIKSKSPFWNRRDLIEVGAAGPIAGWLVAVGWLWYGLSQSIVMPLSEFPANEINMFLGQSLLTHLSTTIMIGTIPEGSSFVLTEAAFAGWVGLLVTAINLLPIGQLDGGHILYGLSRQKQYILGIIAMGILLVLGLQSPIWWFFALFGIVFGIKHPPTLNDNKKPGKTAIAMGIISLIILIFSFTPVPFQ